MTDTPEPKRYSITDDGPWHDDLHEMLDALNDINGTLLPGWTYYVINTRPMTSADIASDRLIERLLGTLDDNMAEWFDDPIDAEFSHSEHKDDLKRLIHEWINRHERVALYWIIDSDPQEHVITEENLHTYIENLYRQC